MRKVIIFVKRRPGVSRQQFFAWLQGEERARCVALPGLRGLAISLEADGEDGVFDGMLEFEFADRRSATDAFAGDAGKALLSSLVDHVAHMERVDLEAYPFVDTGGGARFKLVAALKRRDDLTREEFKSWWLDRHAPQVVAFPELGRYQVNVVEDGRERFVDGIAEVAFADLATLKRITSSAQVKGVQGDSQVHTSARYRLYVQEHRVAV